MKRSDENRLADMLDACDGLREIAAAGRERFDADWTLRSASERMIEIIGEAAGSLSDTFAEQHADLPIVDSKSMRNRLAHEYWQTDPEVLWAVTERDALELGNYLRGLGITASGIRNLDHARIASDEASLIDRAGPSGLLPPPPEPRSGN